MLHLSACWLTQQGYCDCSVFPYSSCWTIFWPSYYSLCGSSTPFQAWCNISVDVSEYPLLLCSFWCNLLLCLTFPGLFSQVRVQTFLLCFSSSVAPKLLHVQHNMASAYHVQSQGEFSPDFAVTVACSLHTDGFWLGGGSSLAGFRCQGGDLGKYWF